LYSRHSQYLSSLVGTEFEFPPLGVTRLVMYGEIVSARNFEYDDLFVRYIVHVPSRGMYFVYTQYLYLYLCYLKSETKIRFKLAALHFEVQTVVQA